MKRSDLKAGVLYAVRNINQPCMLLSTDVHERRQDHGGIYYRATPNHKPERSKRQWGLARIDYGFVLLVGDVDWLTILSPGAAILEKLTSGRYDPAMLPEDTRLDLATSLAAIEGPYVDAMAHRASVETARQEKGQREADAWNKMIAPLNEILGPHAIPVATWSFTPGTVTLTPSQVKLIADALAAKEA